MSRESTPVDEAAELTRRLRHRRVGSVAAAPVFMGSLAVETAMLRLRAIVPKDAPQEIFKGSFAECSSHRALKRTPVRQLDCPVASC